MAVDLRKLRAQLIHHTRAPASQVLADLQVLRGLDAEMEKKQARAGTVGCTTALLGLGLLLLSTALVPLAPLFAGAAALLLLTALISGIRRFVHKRLNLENRRYELVSRLLELLRADIAPSEPLTLELDLRPDTHAAKFHREGETRTGWKVKHYLDPWLSLQGRLLDGTHFHVELTERVEERSRWKKNSRGKSKHKTKKLSDAIARVQLRVKPERYQHLGRLGPHASQAVQLPPGTQLKRLDVEADRLTLMVLVDSPWDTHETDPTPVNAVRVVAMMFLSLYQVLNLSRAIDKKKVAHSLVG